MPPAIFPQNPMNWTLPAMSYMEDYLYYSRRPEQPNPAPATREEAEAWMLQFAARAGLNPAVMMDHTARYLEGGISVDLTATGKPPIWSGTEWKGFWWVYLRFFAPHHD